MLSTSDSKFNELWQGFSSPLRALRLLLSSPKLLSLFVLPMAITVICISIAIYGILTGLWGVIQGWLSAWLSSTWAGYGAGALSLIAAVIISYFALSSLQFLIQLIASPFNDLLAEQTELALGIQSESESLTRLIQVFLIDLRKTLLVLVVTVGLFIWSALPVLGLLSIIGMAWLQAFTFLSYPQTRRRLGLQTSLIWMLANPLRSLGFGFACMILFYTPIINLFALPICVMAGTLTYLKK